VTDSWLTATDGVVEAWPVRWLDAPDVGAEIAVPDAWSDATRGDEGPAVVVRVEGRLPGEGLVIARIGNATTGRNIGDWIELPMSVVGGLDPQTLVAKGDTEILMWQRDEVDDLAARLQLDEVAAYDGLAKFVPAGADAPELVHSYVLLARRGDDAWKVALTLSSACLPGMPDDVMDANDHVRARACFGQLRFD
jgi:hypothetical protein